MSVEDSFDFIFLELINPEECAFVNGTNAYLFLIDALENVNLASH